jgi:hypothetical protein
MPSEIYIPFMKEFEKTMKEGKKTKTSRNKKYGKPGMKFKIFGQEFELTEIKEENLDYIANNFYEEEGFSSPEEFKEIWKKLHPRKGWVPDQVVFIHEFKKC